MSTDASEPPVDDAPSSALRAWWRVMDLRVGIVPVPVFLVILGLLAAWLSLGTVKTDILTMMAVLSVGGFACAEIGKRLPLLGQIGAAAIFATFAPSYLVYAGIIPAPLKDAITTFTSQSNFLYLFISAIIVGSILGMDRKILIAGFLKIIVPLAAGSVAALLVGMGVGALLGMDLRHTLFFVVIPIMAGGVGEGAIPLSLGYGQILHQPEGPLFAEVLPAVMFGSLTAIVLAGALNSAGKRYPSLTGEGKLSPEEHDVELDDPVERAPAVSPATIGAAALLAITLYLVGALAQTLWKWPGPVTMLGIAVLLKLLRAVSPDLEAGAFGVYQFFRTAVTYPLLFAIGVAMTPWETLMAALHPANIITIACTVAAMMSVSFFTARFVGLYPIDTAIVAACHSGQGGTGDVAILTAANRMQLMPFAQIATRIGGAITVTLALLAFARFA